MSEKRDKKPLSDKHQRFVAEYLIDGNASAAYRRAGYIAKGNSAEVNAGRLLRNTQVQAEIAKARSKMLQKLELSAERVLLEIARIAFFDPRKLLNADGSPKALTELDDDTAAAIQGVDYSEITSGENVIGAVKKYRVADKNSALEKALKVLGLTREKVEVTGKDGAPLFDTREQQVEGARRLAFALARANAALQPSVH